MPPNRVSKRKRQTKLPFSPAAVSNTVPLSVRESKKRKAVDLSDDDDSGIPTPKRSFRGLEPDKQELRRSMRQGMPKGGKTGMFNSSDNDVLSSSSDDSDTPPKGKAPAVQPPKKAGKAKKADSLPPKRQTRSKKSEAPAQESESESSKSKIPPAKKQTRSKRTKPTAQVTESESSENQTPPKKGNNRSKKAKAPVQVNESESSENETPPNKRSKKSRKTTAPVQVNESESSENEKALIQDIESGSSESDDAPISGRRSRRISSRRGRSISAEPERIETEDDSEEERDLQMMKRQMQQRQKSKQQAESDSEDNSAGESKEDEKTPGSDHNRTEKDELDEDLQFLQSSPFSKDDRRNTKPRALNKRQQALEDLKRRRAQNGGSAVPSSSAPVAPSPATPWRRRVVIESDEEEDLEVIPEEDEGKETSSDDENDEDNGEEEEEDEISDDEPKSRRKEQDTADMFVENDEDAGFIDDDPDAVIGEPADLHSIPLEFTSMGRAKARDLFKYAVEWMVQKKINPAFDSRDEIYTLAFRRLNDEVAALANSKYSSAAWTPEFTRTLRARPVADFGEIDKSERTLMDHHCEACNRRSHPATWNVCFTGVPYDKESLEPLVEESDSDSDTNSDSGSEISVSEDEEHSNGEKKVRDAHGEILPPESKVFTLGSTCKANAQMTHTLTHWRWHLNTWVVDYLTRMGHCTPAKLTKRDKWSQSKRNKAATKIVDQMEKSGEIRKLHKLYKDQVEFAMEADNSNNTRWGRN